LITECVLIIGWTTMQPAATLAPSQYPVPLKSRARFATVLTKSITYRGDIWQS
jgi:hypothetical protein